MSTTYRVTLSFDMTIDDEAVVQQIAHDAVRQMAEETGDRPPFADTPLQAADYAAQDVSTSVNMTAVLMLLSGAEQFPDSITVTDVTVASEPSEV